MTLEEARRKVRALLDSWTQSGSPQELQILDEHTKEILVGWVFFYQSAEYIRTKDFRHALAGNAPILVDSRDGSLHVTGTANRTEYYVQNYINTGSPHVVAVPVLVILGWREGAQKVRAVRLLYHETSLGLPRSKQCIDNALANIPTTIELSDFEHAERLRASLDVLGWEVVLERRAPQSLKHSL